MFARLKCFQTDPVWVSFAHQRAGGLAARVLGCSGAWPEPLLASQPGTAWAQPSLAVCPMRRCSLCVSRVTCSSWHLGVFELLERHTRAMRSPTLVPSAGRLLTPSLCRAERVKRGHPGAAPVETGTAEIRS